MCGIVGWVDYEKDLKNKKSVIEKMAQTLSKRGPDDTGFYVSENALMGHRRLIVVDPEGGAQPMTRTVGDYAYTIVYNGELYNTEDIRKLLVGKGYGFKSYSDTEVLLVSYIEWGEECVDYLNGIFAFGIWDEREEKIFLARDRLGVKPLFYVHKGSSFIFGSEIKALMAHPEIDAAIDGEGLMEVFGLGPARSPGSGVFKGVKEIKPGYCMSFSRNGEKSRRYWQLESKRHAEDLQTTAEHVRGLLLDAVERQLVSDVPVCTFLSGGLDSSAISSITSRAFKRQGKGRLRTYSIEYEDNDIYFKANEYQPDSDSEWAGVMADCIASEHRNVVVDIPDLVNALEDAVKANDLPGMADVDSSLFLFCREVRKDATVALSGECADEILGGYPWFRRLEDMNGDTFPWSRSVSERLGILSGKLGELPLEEYVRSKYRETLKEVPHLDGESGGQRRMRELFYLNYKWFMLTLLNRKDRMSMANSLEVRVPFADHRIVEYTWNIPWEMKFCDNREKGLLRRALIDILPKGVIERRKSPYPKTHHPEYTKRVQEWMRSILNDPESPILELINVPRVKEIVETAGKSFGRPWFGQLMTGPQMIAYLIQVDLWLRHYNVNIKI